MFFVIIWYWHTLNKKLFLYRLIVDTKFKLIEFTDGLYLQIMAICGQGWPALWHDLSQEQEKTTHSAQSAVVTNMQEGQGLNCVW